MAALAAAYIRLGLAQVASQEEVRSFIADTFDVAIIHVVLYLGIMPKYYMIWSCVWGAL